MELKITEGTLKFDKRELPLSRHDPGDVLQATSA